MVDYHMLCSQGVYKASGVFLSLYLCSNLNNFTNSFIDFLLTALGQTTVGYMSMGCKQQFHKI